MTSSPIMTMPAIRSDRRFSPRGWAWLGALVLATASLPAAAAPAGPSGRQPAGLAAPAPRGTEEFFIISSLDPARGRIVLKRPTEVTVTMRVTEQTGFRDEQGKALQLANLRAGATVYITSRQDVDGGLTAQLVRLGPMTVQMLHQRYLKLSVPPQ